MEDYEYDNYVGGVDDLYSGDFMSPEEYDNYVENLGNLYSGDLAGSGFDFSKVVNAAGKIDWGKLLTGGAGVAAGISGLMGGGGGSQKPTGYQGTVPSLTAVREQLPMPVTDPARRPGSAGRRYFTDTQYVPKANTAGIAAAQTGAQQQAAQITQPNQVNQSNNSSANDNTNWASGDGGYRGGHIPNFAHGGLLGLAQGGGTGYYLGGKTDGMADKIPATIADKQPAKLSHGEFVVSADVVSALGSGNSEAGAKVLYNMMDRVRKHAHGTKKQIKPANLKKTLPA